MVAAVLHSILNRNLTLMRIYFIPLLFILACCQDKNPDPGLPPITTTGANTFGCKVNGKIWMPSPRSNGTLPQIEGGIKTRYDSVGPEKNWYDLLIFAYNNNNGSGFQLFLSRINATGEFPLYFTNCVFPACLVRPSYGYYYENGSRFSALTISESKINLVRYDTLNKIFSGTFSFKAKAFYGPSTDTINITEGRFDIDQKKIN